MRRPTDGPVTANKQPYTPSSLYSEKYFLTNCEGFEDFVTEAEEPVVPVRLRAALELAKPKPGERVLDLGCGRGEAAYGCAQRGAAAYGADYSADALQIAGRNTTEGQKSLGGCIRLVRADAKQLPFAEGSFDKLLMFDLVEHLYPWELTLALREAWRVLNADGQLIVHTAPNRWYYRFGYPLYRLFERLRGRRLPADPRSRFPFHHLHVNEQDIIRMRRSLRQAGFDAKVWLHDLQPPLADRSSVLIRLLVRVLVGVYPLRWIFRNDIFAVAHKRG